MIPRFGTIRNNTALKHSFNNFAKTFCFGTIRNNTALKQIMNKTVYAVGFGTIRNNTALKQPMLILSRVVGFGTIRNNTALKLIVPTSIFDKGFWNHSKQHSSKTIDKIELMAN